MSLLLALFGCTPAPSRLYTLPTTFTPTAVLPDAATILGFEGGPFVPLVDRRLSAHRVGVGAVGPGGPGWYQAAASGGGELWAVAATASASGTGSDYHLWIERSGEWSDQGAIPATSVTSVAVAASGVGWVVGVRQLLRTEDAGGTWTMIAGAPAPGNVAETLGVLGPNGLVLGGGALLSTNDKGATWRTLSNEPALATDGRWVVSGSGEPWRVGRIEAGAVTWTGALPTDWLPDAVVDVGGSPVIRATRRGTVALLTTEDGGRSFRAQRLGAGDARWVGLGAKTWWVEVDRIVRAR